MSEPAVQYLPDLRLPAAYSDLMAPLGTYRYRVYYGGRASAKSWSLGRALLLHGAQSKLRVLCAREYQASIRQSVHQLLSAQIVEMGLDSFYSVDQAMIRGANWTEIFFAGVKRDPAQIKSMEGIDLCWVAEAQSVSDESWEILIPTIRQERSEIWLEFNPYQVTDPTWQRFVKRPPPRSIVREVSWRDNPWLSSTMREERDELLRRDPEAEAHVWGGQPWSKSGAQVLGGRFRVEAIEPQDDWTGPYFGADWGFARDPTVLVRCWIAGQRLVVDYDVRGIGWNMDEIDRRFRTVPGAADHVIRGDSARPETINELRRRGLNVVAADKWPGSREDGVNHLTGYEEIVIDPRCEGLIEEARLWRYKTDPRTGDVLPKLLDGYDHGWDGVRYALAPMIKSPNPWGVANL